MNNFIYDKKIKISTGRSRKDKQWINQELYWSDFVNKLSTPVKTEESFEEYKKMPKSIQDNLKDVGGYVGGELKDNTRKNENVLSRYIVTLDADNIVAGGTQNIINTVDSLGCAYVIYSTRKHESIKPRLRIIFPLARPCTPDEYEPIARKIASYIGIEIFDPTTFEAVRLMYWASISKDSEFVFSYADKLFIDTDGILKQYNNWKDCNEWATVPTEKKLREKSIKKQGNPLEKDGIVGAFCKIYNIENAIATYLSDIYEPYELLNNRYTYLKGSTVGGAIVYEDGNFLYSHHATDPCGNILCNSFDLVRIHMFGDLDYQAKPDTPTTQMPSYKKMCEFVTQDKEVVKLLSIEKYNSAMVDFGQSVTDDVTTSTEWLTKLKRNSKSGTLLKTAENVCLILENDPNLKDKFYYNDFAKLIEVCSKLPWNNRKIQETRRWDDMDDAGLRFYLEKVYDITGENKINDGFKVYLDNHRVNKVQEFLKGLQWDNIKRIDTLLIDYFGAEDNIYTRTVTRKTLIGAVARAMTPGIKFDTMLILAGKQGEGKSTFFRKLGKEWYSANLPTLEGKEAAEIIQGYWILELEELDTFRKSDVRTIKSFLSRQIDVYRAAYGRNTQEYPRTCILCGTSNNYEFLKDKTGGRRFFPVDVGIYKAVKSPFTDLDNEVDQIWAEAFNYWKSGEKIYLDSKLEKEAKIHQEIHTETSPKEGVIKEFIKRRIPKDWNKKDLNARRLYWAGDFKTKDEKDTVERDKICAAEIWCECFYGDLKQMKRSDVMEINDILSNIEGWERSKKPFRVGSDYGLQRGFLNINSKLL